MSSPAGFTSYGMVNGKLYSREDALQYLMSQRDSDEEEESAEDEVEDEESGRREEIEDKDCALEAKDEESFKVFIKCNELGREGHPTVAFLYTMLGELQLKIGKLDEAEQTFKTSLDIYQNHTYYPNQEYECATVREHLAQVAEAQGDMKGAKKIRLSCGKNKLRCANIHHVTKGDFLNLTESSHCKRCKSVYYCSAECQKEDWEARHKTWCSPGSSSKTTVTGA